MLKALESVTVSDLMLASPGLVLRSNRNRGFVARVVPLRPICLTAIVGLNGSLPQLTTW